MPQPPKAFDPIFDLWQEVPSARIHKEAALLLQNLKNHQLNLPQDLQATPQVRVAHPRHHPASHPAEEDPGQRVTLSKEGSPQLELTD